MQKLRTYVRLLVIVSMITNPRLLMPLLPCTQGISQMFNMTIPINAVISQPKKKKEANQHY